MDKIKLPSYAKINLSLKVKGRRPDGFHEIETIFQQVDLHDTLELERQVEGIHIKCTHPRIPEDETNICFKAAKLFQSKTNFTGGIQIKIDKQIPPGAGLGGGSSNAACVLMGLNLLWKTQLSVDELLELANTVGSDVAFFFHGGTAIATGRGEMVQPIVFPSNFWCLLIYPNVEISTTWVYKNFNFNLTNTENLVKLLDILNNTHDLAKMTERLSNDLEEVVFGNYPELLKLKSELRTKGAFYSSMSGSGSTIYGLFQTRKDALTCQRLYESRYLTFLTQPIKWGYGEVLQAFSGE